MDIKLILNTNQLDLSLEEISLDFGIVEKEKIFTDKNKFSLKISKQIDKILSNFYKISTVDKEIVDNIIECITFIKNQKFESIKELNIKINVKSAINQFKNNKINPFGIVDYDDDLYLINAIPYSNIMNFGVNAFKKEKDIPEDTKILLSSIGVKETIEFVFLHEFGHTMEIALLEKDNSSFLKSIHDLKFNKYSKEEIKKIKKELGNQFEINKNWSRNISVLSSEIYADTIALLIKRNKYIDENKSNNDLLNFIEHIKNWRAFHRKEIPISKHCEEDYMENISHFTLIGINMLCEKIEILKEKLNEREMHILAKEIQEKAISKVLFSQIKANPKIMEQLLQISDKNELNIKNIIRSYRKIRVNCTEEWISQFEQNIKQIDNNKEMLENKSFHIFDIGLSNNKNVIKKIDKKIKY